METEACPTCEGSGTIETATPQELRELRVAAGLTQHTLAAILNLSSSAYISDIENGNRKTNPALVRRWIAACRDRGASNG